MPEGEQTAVAQTGNGEGTPAPAPVVNDKNIAPADESWELQYRLDQTQKELDAIKGDEAYSHLSAFKNLLQLHPENIEKTKNFLASLANGQVAVAEGLTGAQQDQILALQKQLEDVQRMQVDAGKKQSLQEAAQSFQKEYNSLSERMPQMKHPIVRDAIFNRFKNGGKDTLLDVAKSVIKDLEKNPLSTNVIPKKALDAMKDAPKIQSGNGGSAEKPPEFNNITEALQFAAKRLQQT